MGIKRTADAPAYAQSVRRGLRFLYSSDPPYNCFPSLHAAHSFVSALTCYRVHRGVGIAAVLGASGGVPAR
jgi:hypothetical protein